MKKLRLLQGVALAVVALALSGCDQEEAPTDQGAAPGEIGFAIPACETYFSKMQACVKQQLNGEQQQQLTQALTELKEQMTQFDDQDALKEQCEQALSQIDEQMKAQGCSV